MHSILKKAYLDGTSFKDCVEELKNASGLHKNHLKVVFNQNLRQVYSFARYEKQLISDKPYLRYVAIMDNRVRDSHKAFHGLILPKEHSFWRNNYPPNGWGCRCKIQALSEEDTEALGYTGTLAPLLNIPDDGFKNGIKSYEQKIQNLTEYLNEQVKGLPHEVHKAVNTRIKESLMQIREVRNNYNTIKKVFNDDKEQKYKGKLLKVGNCDILGQDLPLFLSLENVFIHKHRKHITAYDYAMILQMLKNIKSKTLSKAHSQAEVVVSRLSTYYRLAIKKTSKNEAIVTSITQERKWE
ncbi:phage minor head protein [Campylobacter sp. RM12651]|uniref:phage head morphogenesis protein n=1 Tax=Campylobacter sp. RM12651 TaxID=1660079 RepID=UPI001EFA814B|nr:phage minor head protein [Campylobacter sp. RM12651]